MTDAAHTPLISGEVLAALARLNSKHFEEGCAALASVLGVSAKALRTGVLEAQKNLGTELPFEVHLPCVEDVTIAEHLTKIASFVRRYIVISEEQADAIALWIAYTYSWEEAEHSPLLIINAPQKSCGKTILQDITASLSQRAMGTANATPAALFRIIESFRPTVFIDEADTFLGRNPDAQGLINAGHKRGKPIWRTEAAGDAYVVKPFDVFCPKSIAGIALERHLPDATMSRGIVINMRRRLKEEKVERWGRKHLAEAGELARGLALFGVHERERVERADPMLPDELSDRDQDNWLPLFAVAQCAGSDWEARAVRAALEITKSTPQPESVSHELLHDIQLVLQEIERERFRLPSLSTSGKFIATADLHAALTTSAEFT